MVILKVDVALFVKNHHVTVIQVVLTMYASLVSDSQSDDVMAMCVALTI